MPDPFDEPDIDSTGYDELEAEIDDALDDGDDYDTYL